MTDLDQVIKFRSTSDAALANRGAINCRPRSNLNIVFYHNSTSLRNLQPVLLFILGKTKPV